MPGPPPRTSPRVRAKGPSWYQPRVRAEPPPGTCPRVHAENPSRDQPHLLLNPPPTSLPIASLWVIPVHQPQASCILHQTWTAIHFL